MTFFNIFVLTGSGNPLLDRPIIFFILFWLNYFLSRLTDWTETLFHIIKYIASFRRFLFIFNSTGSSTFLLLSKIQKMYETEIFISFSLVKSNIWNIVKLHRRTEVAVYMFCKLILKEFFIRNITEFIKSTEVNQLTIAQKNWYQSFLLNYSHSTVVPFGGHWFKKFKMDVVIDPLGIIAIDIILFSEQ